MGETYPVQPPAYDTGRGFLKVYSMTKVAEAGLAFLTTLWLGLLLGVSFLATPVKFRAPSLELPVALEVGRVTFDMFSKVELVLAALLVISLAILRPGVARILASALVILIVIVEAFWLLPALDARVSQIVAGAPGEAGSHHMWYVLGEGSKALLLLGIAIGSLQRLGWSSRP